MYRNNFMRQTLLSLRLVAGPLYPRILAEAGLTHYEGSLPPADPAPEIPEDEVTRLFGVAHAHLLNAQIVLFLTNVGEHQAENAWEYPDVQAITEALAEVPPADRVVAAWTHFNTILERDGRRNRTVYSDEQNDYLVVEQCPYCRTVRGATRPVCFSVVRYYEVLLHKWLGRTVVMRELECVATGQDRCVFAVRRERPPVRAF
jgi:hypothetical protein